MQTQSINTSLPPAPPFVVTLTWLRRHGTRGCGWSRAQIEALGLDYPQPTGWLQKTVGRRINQEQRIAFENAQKPPVKRSTVSGSPVASPATTTDTMAQLEAYLRAVAVLSRVDGPIGEFLKWIPSRIGRLAPGVATRKDVQDLSKEAAGFVRAMVEDSNRLCGGSTR